MKESADDFENIDYTDLPEPIKNVVKNNTETIEKDVKVSYDGKQHIIRIPTEISRALDIQKGDIFKTKATLYPQGADKEDEFSMTYVKKHV